jgi:hypothetical protein
MIMDSAVRKVVLFFLHQFHVCSFVVMFLHIPTEKEATYLYVDGCHEICMWLRFENGTTLPAVTHTVS